MNNICGPSNVSVELSIKYNILQMISDLSKKVTKEKVFTTSRCMRNGVRLGFCTTLISAKSARTVHIFSFVMYCHTYTFNIMENTLPFESLNCSARQLL